MTSFLSLSHFTPPARYELLRVAVLARPSHAEALSDWRGGPMNSNQEWSALWARWLFPDLPHPYLDVRLHEEGETGLEFTVRVPTSATALKNLLEAKFPALTFAITHTSPMV